MNLITIFRIFKKNTKTTNKLKKQNRMDKNGVIGSMIIDSDGLCLACKLQI